MPHAHVPEAEQLSAAGRAHETQAAPSVPQVEVDEVVHVVPAQQPVGQDAELQTQAPAEQSWPAPHAGPEPHLQAPEVQLSAEPGAQATQAAPPEPHALSEGVLHVSPEQHPDEHVELQPLHAPLVQLSVPMHAWQADPPLPQALGALPVSHVDPLQHPVGQDAPSQTHLPPKQRWPVPHAAPAPQEHAPLASHPSATVGSQLAQEAPGAAHAVNESGLHVAPALVQFATQAPFE